MLAKFRCRCLQWFLQRVSIAMLSAVLAIELSDRLSVTVRYHAKTTQARIMRSSLAVSYTHLTLPTILRV